MLNWATTRGMRSNSVRLGIFIPSSDVNAVFGRLLARQFDEIWRALGSPPQIEILELGPGRGLFALDVLTWSEKKFPAFFHALHYSLAERSPKLRERLRGVLTRFLESGTASSVSEGAERRPSGAKALVPGSVRRRGYGSTLPRHCRKLLPPDGWDTGGHDFSRAKQCHGRAGFSPRGSGDRVRQ